MKLPITIPGLDLDATLLIMGPIHVPAAGCLIPPCRSVDNCSWEVCRSVFNGGVATRRSNLTYNLLIDISLSGTVKKSLDLELKPRPRREVWAVDSLQTAMEKVMEHYWLTNKLESKIT